MLMHIVYAVLVKDCKEAVLITFSIFFLSILYTIQLIVLTLEMTSFAGEYAAEGKFFWNITKIALDNSTIHRIGTRFFVY